MLNKHLVEAGLCVRPALLYGSLGQCAYGNDGDIHKIITFPAASRPSYNFMESGTLVKN
jgi:hypothetical protein